MGYTHLLQKGINKLKLQEIVLLAVISLVLPLLLSLFPASIHAQTASQNIVLDSLTLTDSKGQTHANNLFAQNEPMYVQVSVHNSGSASIPSGVLTEIYANQPSTVAVNTKDSPEFAVQHGSFSANSPVYTYQSWSGGHWESSFVGTTRSFQQANTGSYTARAFADATGIVSESSENDNQVAVNYTVLTVEEAYPDHSVLTASTGTNTWKNSSFYVKNSVSVQKVGFYSAGAGNSWQLLNSDANGTLGSQVASGTLSSTQSSNGYYEQAISPLTLNAGSYYIFRVNTSNGTTYYGSAYRDGTNISFRDGTLGTTTVANEAGTYEFELGYTLSSSPTPTPTSTNTPTPTPTKTPTPTPSGPTSTPSPTPTATPTPTAKPNLVTKSLVLTDSRGYVHTNNVFAPNEPIFVRLTVANTGAATAPSGVVTEIYANKGSTVSVGTKDSPEFVLTHGFFPVTTSTYTYESYPGGHWVTSFGSTKSFQQSAVGTYTARIFIDAAGTVSETSESDNQLTATYSISNTWPQPVVNPSAYDTIVNKKYVLPSDYAPSDLIDPGIPNTNGELLRRTAANAEYTMRTDAANVGVYIRQVSGYRSYDTQTSLYNDYVNQYGQASADTFSARPGHSEHQLGLAADLSDMNNTGCDLDACFANTDAGVWLANNAANYGFILRYPNGKDSITGYEFEPWHFRYVGVTLAKAIKASGLTMEEYFHVPGGDY